MGIKVTIELTDEQVDKIIKHRNPNREKDKPCTFSIAKASRLIGISQSTIHRRIKDGFIKTEMIGKSPRISQEEINRFINVVEK
jgi:excisionase family DNA binding protein